MNDTEIRFNCLALANAVGGQHPNETAARAATYYAFVCGVESPAPAANDNDPDAQA